MVQPFDSGKIAAIHVANGQHVKAGDVLLEIDPAEAQADANSARDARYENLAEIARRTYAVDRRQGAATRARPATTRRSDFERAAIDQAIAEAEDGDRLRRRGPPETRLRQRGVLAADLNQLADQLSALDKQIAQKEATQPAPRHEHRLPEPADGHARATA